MLTCIPGPDTAFLVGIGAKYSACMRKDIAAFANIARQREEEEKDFGCCQNSNDPTASLVCGITREEDCDNPSFKWTKGTTCPESVECGKSI